MHDMKARFIISFNGAVKGENVKFSKTGQQHIFPYKVHADTLNDVALVNRLALKKVWSTIVTIFTKANIYLAAFKPTGPFLSNQIVKMTTKICETHYSREKSYL
jgi:hypothetical protein